MKPYCTYKTAHPDGRYYYGTTNVTWIDRGYQGSGTAIVRALKAEPDAWTTEVLETFETKRAALDAERALTSPTVLADPLNLNLRKGGHSGERHPCTLFGVTYPTVRAAAKATGAVPSAVTYWNGQVQEVVDKAPTVTLCVNGVHYPTLVAAADALGVDRHAMSMFVIGGPPKFLGRALKAPEVTGDTRAC